MPFFARRPLPGNSARVHERDHAIRLVLEHADMCRTVGVHHDKRFEAFGDRRDLAVRRLATDLKSRRNPLVT